MDREPIEKSRRSLLKGVVAAPLVLTVRPASAVAVGSVAACVENDALKATNYSTKPAEISAVDSDEWMRVRLYVYYLYDKKKPHKKERIPGLYFLGTDNTQFWQLVNKGSGKFSAKPTEYTVFNVHRYEKAPGHYYALSYVDGEGSDIRQVGYASEPNGGTPITTSCWASVSPIKV